MEVNKCSASATIFGQLPWQPFFSLSMFLHILKPLSFSVSILTVIWVSFLQVPCSHIGGAKPVLLLCRCCFFHHCCLKQISSMGCRVERSRSVQVSCEEHKPRCESDATQQQQHKAAGRITLCCPRRSGRHPVWQAAVCVRQNHSRVHGGGSLQPQAGPAAVPGAQPPLQAAQQTPKTCAGTPWVQWGAAAERQARGPHESTCAVPPQVRGHAPLMAKRARSTAAANRTWFKSLKTRQNKRKQ